MIAGRPRVQEDIDLVAYSAVPSFQTLQGVPIKAVYQGAVVGMRYQHPRVIPPDQTPVSLLLVFSVLAVHKSHRSKHFIKQYRRFQITFQSEAAAAAFVDSIRFICPCKPNTGPPPRGPRAQSSVMQRKPTGATQTSNGAHIPTSAANLALASRSSSTTLASDDPLPPQAAVRRSSTTLPSLSRNRGSSSLPTWNDLSSLDRPTQAHSSVSAVSDTLSSADRYNANSARASSAVAHYATSEMSAPSSDTPNFPAEVPLSQNARPDAAFTGYSQDPPGRLPNNAILAKKPGGSGSSDVEGSLPSSSFPPSSSPPPVWPARAHSPALMPPPPVPPQGSLPRGTNPTPTAASQAAATRSTPAPSAPQAACDPTPPSSAPTSVTLRSDVVAALGDSAGLYDLTRGELEKLVAEVVREDGFAELVSVSGYDPFLSLRCVLMCAVVDGKLR